MLLVFYCSIPGLQYVSTAFLPRHFLLAHKHSSPHRTCIRSRRQAPTQAKVLIIYLCAYALSNSCKHSRNSIILFVDLLVLSMLQDYQVPIICCPIGLGHICGLSRPPLGISCGCVCCLATVQAAHSPKWLFSAAAGTRQRNSLKQFFALETDPFPARTALRLNAMYRLSG